MSSVDRFSGMGVRLSKKVRRKLDELARATGRSKGSVIRALVRLASARDMNALSIIREEQATMEAEDAKW